MAVLSLSESRPTIILAPMEGVMDSLLRTVMGEMGGFDFAVSEFIRISQRPLSAKQIKALVPELTNPAGLLPIQVQLLGSHPEHLAATALEACTGGARAIDLNFGCPSPTVTRNGGGSALLREPGKVRQLIATVRRAVPPFIPVSAKIRLGWEAPNEVHELARAVQDGGADWLTIHARTQKDFYRPGVHWGPVAQVRAELTIPVVANGDIFDEASLARCREQTGCRHYMLGRGALLDPMLGRRLALFLEAAPAEASQEIPAPEAALVAAIRRFVELAEPQAQNKGYVPSRIKQWLQLVRIVAPERIPRPLFTVIARSKTSQDILEQLADWPQGGNPIESFTA